MRFHLPAIPHTATNIDYLSCAYTQKVFKLCGMLKKLGHEVYHYGCEGSTPESSENIAVVSEPFRKKYYPTDYHRQQFKYDTSDEYHRIFYENCIREIKKRQGPHDFLLCAWGWGHKPVADHFNDSMIVVESGVGYESIFSRYRVFESYTWMAHVYGLNNIKNGPAYDAVIPNFFDPESFIFSEQKEDWFLYLGRIVHRKGVEVAVQVTKEIGAKLVIAGQGTLKNESENLNITDDHVHHAGFADLEKRKYLLSKAKAVFMPTYYIEPFGGVSIEAAMSGTPVISSDWGVFGENVLYGITGYRCRTYDQYCRAAENIHHISPKACRDWAFENFTTDRVALMYQEYFEMLYELWGKGWYSRSNNRKVPDWLTKTYPALPSTLNKPEQPEKSPCNSGTGNTSSNLPKIVIWSRLSWAFGNISKNIKKIFNKEYSVELFSWDEIYKPGTFDRFDLVYVPTWPARLDFLRLYPDISSKKVICGIHGEAELFNHRFQQDRGVRLTENIQAEMVDAFEIPSELIAHLATIPAIGVVNRKLLTQIKERTGLDNLFLTECGVDSDEFEPVPVQRPALNILYPVTIPQNASSTHGYDVKRFRLLSKLKQNIGKDLPGVQLLVPDGLLTRKQMTKWYPMGDVHLCISHSEGGPLVALESAACGLVQVATPVGIITDLIEHQKSGFIISGKSEKEIYEEMLHYFSVLDKDRDLLQDMKLKTRTTIENQWTWEMKHGQWHILFKKGLECSCRTIPDQLSTIKENSTRTM